MRRILYIEEGIGGERAGQEGWAKRQEIQSRLDCSKNQEASLTGRSETRAREKVGKYAGRTKYLTNHTGAPRDAKIREGHGGRSSIMERIPTRDHLIV